MKKFLTLALAVGLVAGAIASPAVAGKKKKVKPVKTTLYMHGQAPAGEADGLQWLADGAGPQSPMTLDTNEPTDPAPKSMNYFSPLLNDECTGLPLGFPTFTGPLAGTIVGDAKMTLHFASAPATIKARIWADVGAFSACNSSAGENYIEPASEVDVEVPAGSNAVEVVFPKLKLKSTSFVMIEVLALSGTDYKGQVGRLLYDSTATPSSITFNCIPVKGKSCA